MYMHAIFVVQRSKLCSFQREGRGSEYEMNDVRFRDNRKLLRRPLSYTETARTKKCVCGGGGGGGRYNLQSSVTSYLCDYVETIWFKPECEGATTYKRVR